MTHGESNINIKNKGIVMLDGTKYEILLELLRIICSSLKVLVLGDTLSQNVFFSVILMILKVLKLEYTDKL